MNTLSSNGMSSENEPAGKRYRIEARRFKKHLRIDVAFSAVSRIARLLLLTVDHIPDRPRWR